METAGAHTPKTSLQNVFLRAAGEVEDEEGMGEVVAESLAYLQQGFDAHYESETGAPNESILVGDNAYAWAVETIAWLDEPEFVAVASQMIRDGAGEISSGKDVSISLWVPHLAKLLQIISGEDDEASRKRIIHAVEEVSV